MDKNIICYYCLNKDIREETLKNGVRNITIIKIPTHISIRITRNMTSYDGKIYPFDSQYVSFPTIDNDYYELVYSMLFPKLNYAIALCNVENKIEGIRNIAIAIIRHKAIEKYFDDWLTADTHGYLCLRP